MARKPGSKLVALVFDDPYKADEARAALLRMGGEGLLEIDETALIARYKDGKTRLSQDVNVAATGKQIGHIAGLVAAAVTGTMPFILAGTLTGRLIGRLSDRGITNDFMRRMKTELAPGTSALIVYARSDAARRGKVFERLRPFGPRVLETDLPPDMELDLDRALANDGQAPA
jgi:uncharacterized membrane protein